MAIAVVAAALLFGLIGCGPKEASTARWVVYYGQNAAPEELTGYDVVVVDPNYEGEIAPLREGGAKVLAYISLGELNASRATFARAQREGLLLEENPNWPGAWVVDVRLPGWRTLVVEERAKALLARGYDGLFLDTLIAGRAEAAAGDERLGWARHLLWVGGARQVLHLLRPALLTQGGTVDPATLEIVLGALADRRDRATIRTLADAAAAIDQVAALRQIASLCAAIGERDRAVATWRRVVALDPGDAAALRTLAYADVAQPAAASRHWAAYFALPESARRGGSWRERAAYAEALDGQAGRAAEAAMQRRVALRLLDDPEARGEPMTDAAVHAAAGRLLLRLGRRKDVIARLQPALAAPPCDDSLRADLTSALMAEGALDKARSIVDPPAACRAGGGR